MVSYRVEVQAGLHPLLGIVILLRQSHDIQRVQGVNDGGSSQATCKTHQRSELVPNPPRCPPGEEAALIAASDGAQRLVQPSRPHRGEQPDRTGRLKKTTLFRLQISVCSNF